MKQISIIITIYYIFLTTVFAFQPQTTAELQTAVDLWISDNASALSTYGDINTWDVSLITDMSELFENKTTLNGDISNWNVSNVTDMEEMFKNATNFNGDLSSWNVSSVTDGASRWLPGSTLRCCGTAGRCELLK